MEVGGSESQMWNLVCYSLFFFWIRHCGFCILYIFHSFHDLSERDHERRKYTFCATLGVIELQLRPPPVATVHRLPVGRNRERARNLLTVLPVRRTAPTRASSKSSVHWVLMAWFEALRYNKFVDSESSISSHVLTEGAWTYWQRKTFSYCWKRKVEPRIKWHVCRRKKRTKIETKHFIPWVCACAHTSSSFWKKCQASWVGFAEFRMRSGRIRN